MDVFMEYIVKHKKSSVDILIIMAIIILTCILSIAVFILSLSIKMLSSLGLIFVAIIVYFSTILIKSRLTEFEYILTNTEMDIDKIMAKSRRKRVSTINFREIEICAAIDDNMHRAEFENKSSIIKTHDCTGDKMTQIYFVDFVEEKGKTRVLFQPPEKLLIEIKKINPRCVFVNDLQRDYN